MLCVDVVFTHRMKEGQEEIIYPADAENKN